MVGSQELRAFSRGRENASGRGSTSLFRFPKSMSSRVSLGVRTAVTASEGSGGRRGLRGDTIPPISVTSHNRL